MHRDAETGIRILLLGTIVLSALMASPLLLAMSCESDAFVTLPPSDAAVTLAGILASPPETARQRRQQLQRALHALEQQGTEVEQLVLGNRARLVLAALALRDGDHEQATRTLTGIALESPAGTRAGLLMAEAALAEQRSQDAVQWYLRIQQHYPFQDDALDGLLNAAAQLSDAGRQAEALTLYQRVADFTVKGLESLQQVPAHAELAFLIEPQAGLDPALQKELAAIALVRHHDLVNDGLAAPASRRHYECLLEQHHQVQARFARIQGEIQRLDAAIAALERRIEQLGLQSEQLKSRLIPGEFDEQQMQTRQQLAQTNNALRRDNSQLTFLYDSRDRLTTTRDRVSLGYARLLDHLATESDEGRQAFEYAFGDALAFKQGRLRTLAAEAYLGMGELLGQQRSGAYSEAH